MIGITTKITRITKTAVVVATAVFYPFSVCYRSNQFLEDSADDEL